MLKAKKKILITGGTGFIGKHLIRKISGTDFEPVFLVRKSSDMSLIQEKNFKYYELDNNYQFDEIFEKEKIDVIIHLASDTRKNNDALSATQANIVLPLSLIKSAKKFGVSRFINTGTTHYPSEDNIYSLSKEYLKNSLKFSGSVVFDFEIDNVYGEEDHENRFIIFVLSSFLKKEKELNLTEGKQVRDFVHVEDVVSLLMTSLNKITEYKKGYFLFAAGSGQAVSVKDVVLNLQKISRGNITQINFGKVPYLTKSDADLLTKIDIGNTKRFFEWHPKISIETGLQRLVDWAQRGKY